MSVTKRRGVIQRVGAIVLLVCVAGAVLRAQPDPRQMSGIPRPDPNLADGLITVRVIRGSFANNVVGHPVELRAGDTVSTVDTDAEGRASFASLSPGARGTVATTLDGQTLESQPFPTPGRGGVEEVPDVQGEMGGVVRRRRRDNRLAEDPQALLVVGLLEPVHDPRVVVVLPAGRAGPRRV